MRTLSSRVPAIIAAGLAVAVAVAIFVLTEQPPDVTSSESDFVNRLLADLFGDTPLYDPQTELWLGIGIRHWAHAAEFWLLGMFVSLAAYCALRPRLLAPGVLSLIVCAACSLIDQCHKLFVPGRHFDCFDLVMDALGYCVAILMVLLVAKLLERRGRDDG